MKPTELQILIMDIKKMGVRAEGIAHYCGVSVNEVYCWLRGSRKPKKGSHNEAQIRNLYERTQAAIAAGKVPLYARRAEGSFNAE